MFKSSTNVSLHNEVIKGIEANPGAIKELVQIWKNHRELGIEGTINEVNRVSGTETTVEDLTTFPASLEIDKAARCAVCPFTQNCTDEAKGSYKFTPQCGLQPTKDTILHGGEMTVVKGEQENYYFYRGDLLVCKLDKDKRNSHQLRLRLWNHLKSVGDKINVIVKVDTEDKKAVRPGAIYTRAMVTVLEEAKLVPTMEEAFGEILSPKQSFSYSLEQLAEIEANAKNVVTDDCDCDCIDEEELASCTCGCECNSCMNRTKASESVVPAMIEEPVAPVQVPLAPAPYQAPQPKQEEEVNKSTHPEEESEMITIEKAVLEELVSEAVKVKEYREIVEEFKVITEKYQVLAEEEREAREAFEAFASDLLAGTKEIFNQYVANIPAPPKALTYAPPKAPTYAPPAPPVPEHILKTIREEGGGSEKNPTPPSKTPEQTKKEDKGSDSAMAITNKSIDMMNNFASTLNTNIQSKSAAKQEAKAVPAMSFSVPGTEVVAKSKVEEVTSKALEQIKVMEPIPSIMDEIMNDEDEIDAIITSCVEELETETAREEYVEVVVEKKVEATPIPKTPGITFNTGQQVVFDGLNKWFNSSTGYSKFEVAGFAGTGKTTIINHWLNQLGLRKNQVALCAYTGTASLVLEEKTPGYACSTAHKLFFENEIMPNGKTRFIPSISKIQGKKLIIIDEASMIGERMWNQINPLMEKVGVKVLIVGDPGQLPPVNDGEVLLRNPEGKLTEIMRQGAGNPIIDLSMAIRTATDSGHAFRFNSEFKVGKNLVVTNKNKLHNQYLAKVIANGGAVIVETNKERRERNLCIRQELGFTEAHLMNGEKVLIKENMGESEEGCAVTNGMVGTASNVKHVDGGVSFTFTPDNFDGTREMFVRNEVLTEQSTPEKLSAEAYKAGIKDFQAGSNVWLGYAITCHASQGGQWKTVVVLGEGHTFNRGQQGFEMQNRWLYTAITRAAQNVVVGIAR